MVHFGISSSVSSHLSPGSSFSSALLQSLTAMQHYGINFGHSVHHPTHISFYFLCLWFGICAQYCTRHERLKCVHSKSSLRLSFLPFLKGPNLLFKMLQLIWLFLWLFLVSEVCFPALDVPSNQAWIGIFKQLSYSVT